MEHAKLTELLAAAQESDSVHFTSKEHEIGDREQLRAAEKYW